MLRRNKCALCADFFLIVLTLQHFPAAKWLSESGARLVQGSGVFPAALIVSLHSLCAAAGSGCLSVLGFARRFIARDLLRVRLWIRRFSRGRGVGSFGRINST